MPKRLVATVLLASLIGCGGANSPTAPTSVVTPSPASTPDPTLMRVEPTNRQTFGPAGSVPAGTVFHLSIVARSAATALRLHRCAEPCSSAFTIQVWSPSTIAVGDELTWRVDVGARYYVWGEDTSTGNSVTIVTDEARGNKLRVTFATGVVLEAWYVTPRSG